MTAEEQLRYLRADYRRLQDENERLRAAMRAAMDATGTGTLHYHLLRDALAGSMRTSQQPAEPSS